jgi:hypothetical protein
VSPSRRLSEPHASLGSSSAPFSREVSSSCFALPPGTFYLLNDARKRGIACSGNGVAAGLTVGPLFRSERRPAFPRSNLERSNRIQRPGLEVTGSADDFVREPLYFLYIEPAVHDVFPNYVISFIKRILITVTSEICFHLFTDLPLE